MKQGNFMLSSIMMMMTMTTMIALVPYARAQPIVEAPLVINSTLMNELKQNPVVELLSFVLVALDLTV